MGIKLGESPLLDRGSLKDFWLRVGKRWSKFCTYKRKSWQSWNYYCFFHGKTDSILQYILFCNINEVVKLQFCPFFIIIFLFLHQENLVELKHHKLVRSIRSGTVSRDLKPNAKTRDQLNVWKRYFCFNYIIIGLFVGFSCSPQS